MDKVGVANGIGRCMCVLECCQARRHPLDCKERQGQVWLVNLTLNLSSMYTVTATREYAGSGVGVPG